MKTQDKQILAMLDAFHPDMVLKAFDLYRDRMDHGFKNLEKDLKENGWYQVDEKPTDKEFYFINNTYWVQTEQARQKHIEKVKKAHKEKAGNKTENQTMDLNQSGLACPECKGKLYKQSVCPKCKDGKSGYKIRLICENNPDHEILL